MFTIDIDEFNAFGFPISLSVFGFATLSLLLVLAFIACLARGAFLWLLEQAFANEFKTLYTTYGLKHYPWMRRKLYTSGVGAFLHCAK